MLSRKTKHLLISVCMLSMGLQAEAAFKFGIDTLQERQFDVLRGKRIGLLTHAAAVNRHGQSTLSVLHRSSRVNLVALFAPEHGIDASAKAGSYIRSSRHKATGLPLHSLYGPTRKPTAQMLRGLDALVVDLQDIGTRSYTYISAMKLAMQACFEQGVGLIVLDRPNPLGGLKVQGPMLDRDLISYVGAFRTPYLHGLTIGELARAASNLPGWLGVSEAIRSRGRLTIVPMQGWKRKMLWSELGLPWRATSPYIRTLSAAFGYPMTGLGTQLSGFRHGLNTPEPFRCLSHPRLAAEVLAAKLNALGLSGLRFKPILIRPKNKAEFKAVYVEVIDWQRAAAVDLNFHLMRLGCQLAGHANPYQNASAKAARSFNIHTGSKDWWHQLKRHGARVPLDGFLRQWTQDAQRFQQQTRRFWLYPTH